MLKERSSSVLSPVESAAPARILVVDDQDDVRRLLVTTLEMEGHFVDEAANAAQGLQRLKRSRYDLILTDYAMPGGTGTWMLREAQDRGLLRDDSVALIVTAHPDIRELSGVEVIAKPLDFDLFLSQVRGLLSKARIEPGRSALVMQRVSDRGAYKIELVLYVSSAAPSSLRAIRNLERQLARRQRDRIKLTVRDLVHEPAAAAEDRITFTPTLVRHFPEPRMWLVGNLHDPDVLEDLLRVCGVEGGR
jgi:two-component system response regulator GlrR